VTVGEVPEPPDGDEGGGGEEGGGVGGVDGDSEREGDGAGGVNGDESEGGGGAELSEVDAVLLLLLLEASAKTVATGARLIARIIKTEKALRVSWCRLEKIFICMTLDAYRLPWNQKFH